jgi:dimethylargininase
MSISHMYSHAITRKPGSNFAEGITTSRLGPPSYELMLEQYVAYITTLRALGLEVIVLDPLPDYPDSYFIEDTAVVTPEIAVITNPGAVPRGGEQDSIDPILARFRRTVRIQPPGTLEGGDVLVIDKQAFIGISERTNLEGASQLARILAEYGYSCTEIPVESGLHLKSGINYVGKNTLLVTEGYASIKEVEDYNQIVLERDEEYAANTLLINDCLITPKGFPSVKEKIEELGLPVIELDVSEARKMDGGLTCMSLRF